MTMDRLERLAFRKIGPMPGERLGPMLRTRSPFGGSILMTSAPKSPRNWVAYGPINTAVRSMIFTPASGPIGNATPVMVRNYELFVHIFGSYGCGVFKHQFATAPIF